MDAGTRQKRVEALEAIKNKAMKMAADGADSDAVRSFIGESKINLAYELPDEEAFTKAARATLAYKRKKGASTQDWYLTWSNANAEAKPLGFFVQIFGLIRENNYKNEK